MLTTHLTRLHYPHAGGVEKHVDLLCKQLYKRGHQSIIITTQHDLNLKLYEKVNNTKIYRIPHTHINNKFKTWQWIWEHRKLILDSDIIHAHDVFWWLWPIKFIFPWTKIYTTFHGYEGSDPPRIGAIIHRKLVESASTKTICIGGFMRRWYYAKPNQIIYGAGNAITLKSKKPIPCNSGKNIKAIFAGRLDQDTGIMTYLELVKELESRGVNLILDVYGSGPQLQQAKNYIKKHCLQVIFHGWVNNIDKVYVQYNYAFVSRYLSIIEAMQAKCFVVAHYNNQIKKDYLTCHPKANSMIIGSQPKTLADTLTSLNENELNQMINSAHGWSSTQTWGKITGNYLKLWNK